MGIPCLDNALAKRFLVTLCVTELSVFRLRDSEIRMLKFLGLLWIRKLKFSVQVPT